MEFHITREKLLALSEAADRIVEKSNAIPILSNMLLSIDHDRLSVVSTDLDILVQIEEKEIQVITPGNTTISSELTRAIVQKLPAHSSVHIKVVDNEVQIKAGRSSFKLPTLPTEDFPQITQNTDGNSFNIDASMLHQALRRVQASISADETRHYLNGVCLDPVEFTESGQLRLISTDGHRLAVTHIKPDNAQVCLDTKIIISRKAVRELIKILSSIDSKVIVEYSEHRLSVKTNSTLFVSKLIDGTYPDYERIIPSLSDTPIIVNTEALKQAIDRVTVISSERTCAVAIDVNKDGQIIEIGVNDPNTGRAIEEISANVATALRIGFNARYLAEFLERKTILSLHFTDEAGPARMSFEDFPQDIGVIMPMRIGPMQKL